MMEENITNPYYNCFNCGRDLGPQLEWMKMQTERGPICYACFNEATNAAPGEADCSAGNHSHEND